MWSMAPKPDIRPGVVVPGRAGAGSLPRALRKQQASGSCLGAMGFRLRSGLPDARRAL